MIYNKTIKNNKINKILNMTRINELQITDILSYVKNNKFLSKKHFEILKKSIRKFATPYETLLFLSSVENLNEQNIEDLIEKLYTSNSIEFLESLLKQSEVGEKGMCNILGVEIKLTEKQTQQIENYIKELQEEKVF